MSNVVYSETESAVLGLKIGRCNEDHFFDKDRLFEQVLAGQYDVCRLKLPASDEMATQRLHELGIPSFFSGSIRRYKTPTEQMVENDVIHPDMVFEVYDGSKPQLLKDMLIDTWGSYPIGYYRTPYLDNWISKEKEIESVYQFYLKQNDPNINPQNGFVFLKKGDQYVGFFAVNHVEGNLESHIGGILSPYRKGGFFLDKLSYIKKYCKENGLKNFVFGARNENAEVQRIFQYVGFQPVGSDNVFHLAPMLSVTQKEPVVKRIFPEKLNREKVYSYLLEECLLLISDLLIGSPISFTLELSPRYMQLDFIDVVFTFPVISTQKALIVIKDRSNKGVVCAHFRIG